MNLAARAPLLLAGFVFLAAALGGCASLAADRQIRERIASIREAILAKRAEGIVEFGTPDWRFVTPDGKSYDRDSYLVRTRKLFSEIEIESLETHVDDVRLNDSRAEVMLTQIMVRVETGADGTRARWKVRYREQQEWIETQPRGWLVSRVQVLIPQRERLPAR